MQTWPCKSGIKHDSVRTMTMPSSEHAEGGVRCDATIQHDVTCNRTRQKLVNGRGARVRPDATTNHDAVDAVQGYSGEV